MPNRTTRFKISISTLKKTKPHITLTSPSLPALTTLSSPTASAHTSLRCPANVATHLPSQTPPPRSSPNPLSSRTQSHILIVQSWLPLRTCTPSLAMLETVPRWPRSVCMHSPVSAFKTRIELSRLPESTKGDFEDSGNASDVEEGGEDMGE